MRGKKRSACTLTLKKTAFTAHIGRARTRIQQRARIRLKRARYLMLYYFFKRLFYSHSMASVLPSRHSSCTQFSVPSRIECRQVTPCRASSASVTKAGTTSKTFFKLRALSFCFCPKRAAGRPWRLDSAENARFETQPPSSLQAASCNRK